jgi:ParB/RepB/Spo0J family partition protein
MSKKKTPPFWGGTHPLTAQTIRTSDIDFAGRHRKDVGNLNALVNSITAVGLLQPIVVTRDRRFITDGSAYRLVAGERRLRAVSQMGWERVPAYVIEGLEDAAELLLAEREENVCRKPFTLSEAVSLGRALEDLERPAAEARKKAGTNQHTEPSGKLPEASKGDTRDKVAEAVGLSGRSYEKAKAVVEAAEKDPDLLPLVQEMDRTGKVDPAYRKMKYEELRGEAPPELTRIERTAADDLLDLLADTRRRLLGFRNQHGDSLASMPPGRRETVLDSLDTVFNQLTQLGEQLKQCPQRRNGRSASTPIG